MRLQSRHAMLSVWVARRVRAAVSGTDCPDSPTGKQDNASDPASKLGARARASDDLQATLPHSTLRHRDPLHGP